MLERFSIAPPNMYNRQVRGQYLYSPVVVVRGADHAHVYVAGKTAIIPDGTTGCVGDLRGQLGLVCKAIKESVEYVGATLDDVVRTVTYVRDIDAYYAVVDERYKYFSSFLPTNFINHHPARPSQHACRNRGRGHRIPGAPYKSGLNDRGLANPL